MASAIKDLQVLPVQTNNIFIKILLPIGYCLKVDY
jgi:hypothetical protein